MVVCLYCNTERTHKESNCVPCGAIDSKRKQAPSLPEPPKPKRILTLSESLFKAMELILTSYVNIITLDFDEHIKTVTKLGEVLTGQYNRELSTVPKEHISKVDLVLFSDTSNEPI